MSASKIRELSPELEERARKELKEDPKRRAADIAHIRDWLKKQPHIRADPDDQTLIALLRGCKFSLERTKEKIDMYYTLRTALPEFFKGRDIRDKNLRQILEWGPLLPLSEPDDDGCMILIGRFGATDPSKFKMEDYVKLNCMMMDIMIRENDAALICGSVTLMDMTGMTLAHATQMSLSTMKKSMVLFTDGYPFRPKAFNYIHNPSIFETIFKIFKSFASEKLKSRLFVHGENMESLYKNMPQRLLPTEYGGHAGTLKELNDAWIKKMDSYTDWFLADADSGVDESKRPGKPKTQQDLFGIEGSFRQLNVD